MDRALRFATLAVAGTSTPDRPTVAELQDDLAALLGEMVEAISGVRAAPQRAHEVRELARHPVLLLRNGLAALPRLAAPAQPPSTRWGLRPDERVRVDDAKSIWKGLVVCVAVAKEGLQQQAVHLSDGERWVALGEVASLAEVLAVSRGDVLGGLGLPRDAVDRGRQAAATLAIEAREVARLAADGETVDGDGWMPPRPGSRVMPVRAVADVPAATANLARLLARGDASTTDLLAVTRVLAQTSRASASALRAVAGTAMGREMTVDPGRTSEMFGAHADALARAVTGERANLAGLTPSSPWVLAQGRELGAAGLPRLRELAAHPNRAAAAMPHLLGYADALPAVSCALRDAVGRLTTTHAVAVRDRSDDAPYPWRPAHHLDLVPFLAHLDTAAEACRRRGARSAQAATRDACVRRTDTPTEALNRALVQRQADLRPATPSHAALTAQFDLPRASGRAIGAPWTA
ncbi:hypothetical protein [Actinotalea sp. K2]|uniref:hypothetical protein n=1 Tax=Actinotalea sp. K2 TaxID=2939438 RepID=UPI002017C488|nr:hypothetical protein [Actinotalea sp. K2]MCL3862952.1 hypothetical protein [Actinotalea sp. K2]